jgi:hypothetical protein
MAECASEPAIFPKIPHPFLGKPRGEVAATFPVSLRFKSGAIERCGQGFLGKAFVGK